MHENNTNQKKETENATIGRWELGSSNFNQPSYPIFMPSPLLVEHVSPHYTLVSLPPLPSCVPCLTLLLPTHIAFHHSSCIYLLLVSLPTSFIAMGDSHASFIYQPW